MGVHKHVHIVSDDGQVDECEVVISKSLADQVTWFAFGGAGATIEFSSDDGSPFQESVFYVPATGSLSSGPASPTAVVDKYYKYTVQGQEGENDPGVIIRN
jgi:hypothetical protein